MGRRLLAFTPDAWLTLFKSQRERQWLEVGDPLPADAEIVSWEIPQPGYERCISMIVQSDSWFGDSREPLAPPTLTIHYAESDELEGSVR